MDTGKRQRRPVTLQLLSFRKEPFHSCIMQTFFSFQVHVQYNVIQLSCLSIYLVHLFNRNWMKDSHYTVTLTPPQTSSACPCVETPENASVRKIKSLVVCLCQTGQVPLPTRLWACSCECGGASVSTATSESQQHTNELINRKLTLLLNEQPDIRAAEHLWLPARQ